MERMDWGDSGYVGEDESPIRFGQVGPQFVEDRDNVFIVIAPQSIVGATIHDSLSAMTEEALRSGKTVILVNPNLNDKPSSAGLMGVRGRAERMEFASSFQDIYNFRLIYPNQAVMFPILGAVMKRSYDAPYVVFKLRSDAHYEVAGAFDSDPGTEDLSKLKI
jgi:adenylate kinase